jgi:hypothetical protein
MGERAWRDMIDAFPLLCQQLRHHHTKEWFLHSIQSLSSMESQSDIPMEDWIRLMQCTFTWLHHLYHPPTFSSMMVSMAVHLIDHLDYEEAIPWWLTLHERIQQHMPWREDHRALKLSQLFFRVYLKCEYVVRKTKQHICFWVSSATSLYCAHKSLMRRRLPSMLSLRSIAEQYQPLDIFTFQSSMLVIRNKFPLLDPLDRNHYLEAFERRKMWRTKSYNPSPEEVFTHRIYGQYLPPVEVGFPESVSHAPPRRCICPSVELDKGKRR